MTVTQAVTSTRDAQVVAAVHAVLSRWLAPALADEVTGDVVVALLAPELIEAQKLPSLTGSAQRSRSI